MFQPSSDSGRMQRALPQAHRVEACLVSTLIRPSGRMQPKIVIAPHLDGFLSVSTLIRPSGRMQPAKDGADGQAGPVSTLIRPSGRMQRPPSWAGRSRPTRFNPHPTFRPDATSAAACPTRIPSGFNPHPTFRPDATPLFGMDISASSRLFQPSSDLQAGCNVRAKALEKAKNRFQPSSDLQAGCNKAIETAIGPQTPLVSTLIRPSGRMQQRLAALDCHPVPCFNPHPTFRPDATRRSLLA